MIRSGRPRQSTAECAACSAAPTSARDVRGVLGRDRLLLRAAALEDGAHVLAVDVLHRDEVLAVRARELVDARDVAVAQDARDLRLVDEHLDEVVVLGEVREHALDRDQVRRGRWRRTSWRDRSRPCRRTRCDRAGGSDRAVEPFSPPPQRTLHRRDRTRGTCPTRRAIWPEIRYHPRMSRIRLVAAVLAPLLSVGIAGCSSPTHQGHREQAGPPSSGGQRVAVPGGEGPTTGGAADDDGDRRCGQGRRGRRDGRCVPAQARGGQARDRGPGGGQGGRRGDREDRRHPGRARTRSTPSSRPSSRSRRRRGHARQGRSSRPAATTRRRAMRRRSTRSSSTFAVKLTPSASRQAHDQRHASSSRSATRTPASRRRNRSAIAVAAQ